MQDLINRAKEFTKRAEALEVHHTVQLREKEQLLKNLQDIQDTVDKLREEMTVCGEATEILRMVSDTSVQESYDFIEKNLNNALAQVFDKERRIKLKEYARKRGESSLAQLELVLMVENGETRSLRLGSGHGLCQIVSLLTLLSLIVITGARRILLLDEVLSGLSGKSRAIISDILWNFTEIGFQFIVNDHGFIPKGSKVYVFENLDGIGRISDVYTETRGVYLNQEHGDFSSEVMYIDTTE